MKKLIVFFLIIALAMPAAALTDLPDISGLSQEELIELNHQIQLRLFSEKLIDGVEVPEGEYLVGEDIPAGIYHMEVVFPNAGGMLTVYQSNDKKRTLEETFLGEFWGVDKIGKMELNENNLVKIHGNTLRFFPYTGLFN